MSRSIRSKLSLTISDEDISYQNTETGKLLFSRFRGKSCALLLQNGKLTAAAFPDKSKIGAIYIAKVRNVVNNIEACFVEIADGEIVLKGKSVFHGYIGGIEDGHFIENGIDCYRTGDNGKAENNLLYCLGRCDRQIKMNGYRIELDEIESCISSIDGVTACAVVPSHASSGKIKNIGAYVSGNNIDEQLIRDELKKSLPTYMIPKTISIVDRLTVNENGKTDRKALVKND